MNWKLIFTLSLVGIVMAFLDTFSHIGNAEPILWLVIFVFYGIIIVRHAPGNYFLHAFLVSVFNGVWIGIIHASFHNTYMTNNPDMVQMEQKMPLMGNLPMTMVVFGPIFGAVFVIINGLIAWIISKLMKKKTATS
ncbi:MAG: hypothetical protein ACHQD9_01160 [Chitinophagales bacterium]